MNVNEKTIWVTGASSGIGRALAVNLSRRGARLILSARSAERLEDCRQACTDPERHVVLPLDLADTASLEKASQRALQECGPIDILINNGGISQRSVVVETRLEVDRRIMEVNFFGAVTLTKLILPSMLSRKSGHIVVNSSVIGKLVPLFVRPVPPPSTPSTASLNRSSGTLGRRHPGDHDMPRLCAHQYIGQRAERGWLDAGEHGRGPGRRDGSDICAEKIVRAIEAERNEVYIGGKEKLVSTSNGSSRTCLR